MICRSPSWTGGTQVEDGIGEAGTSTADKFPLSDFDSVVCECIVLLMHVPVLHRRDSRRRSRSRDRHSSRKDRDRSRSESPPPRRKRERKSGFDVLPPGGVIPGVGAIPGMAVAAAAAAPAASGFSAAPAGQLAESCCHHSSQLSQAC